MADITPDGSFEKSYLRHYISEMREHVLRYKQDYMTVVSGWEGSGKSTLAAEIALAYDPEFDAKTQVVYDLKSFLNYLDTYKDNPGRVCWFDEACLAFLGEDSNTGEAKYFKKIFITHRDLQQIFLMCAPSPWLLTPYIREWRVRDFILIYADGFSKDYQRYYGYYSKQDYAKFITNKKAKSQIILPRDFIKIHKPSVIEPFNLSNHENFTKLFEDVFTKKKEAQERLRQDTREYLDGSAPETENNMWLPHVTNHVLANIEKYITNYHGRISLNDALLTQEFGIGGRRITKVKQIVLPKIKDKVKP